MDETKDRVDTIQDETILKETAVPSEDQPVIPEAEQTEPALAETDSMAISTEDENAEESLTEAANEDVKAAEQDIAEGAPLDADEELPAEEDSPLVMPEPDMTPEENAVPAVPVPAPIPAGPAEKLFSGLSYIGLPVLILFAVATSFLEIWQIRDLWFTDEVRLADAFMNIKNGDWLVLTMNGLPYPDNPPLYFWFMDALTRIPGFPVSAPMAVFLAVVISYALFIGSIWALARGTGFDRRVAFASGLVALSCVCISGVATCPNVDLLFAAFITLGMTCLYRGWIKSFAPFWLAFGWLFMAAATLTKGPLGIAFAVVSSVLFLFWRCTPGRLNSRDGLPGFFLMLLAIAGWLGVLYLDGHIDYIRTLIGGQLAGLAISDWHAGPIWWYYLAALPIIWIPWILLPLFVNWFRALRGIPTAVRTRKTDGGSSWLWIWLVTGLAMLSCLQTKNIVYALPLLAPLAVLTARSLLNLSAGRSRCFYGLAAAILAVVGLALVAIDVYPFVRTYIPAEYLNFIPACMLPWLEALDGTMYMGGILIVTAVALLSLTRLALPGGSLLVTALGMMLMLQPYHWFVVPSMTKLLSPRAQASVMAEKVKEGFAPAAFDVSSGAYTWHLNDVASTQGKRLAVTDLNDEAAFSAFLDRNAKAVIAMPKTRWETLTAKPEGASILLTQWLVHKPYVVVAIEKPAAAPAAEEVKPAAPATATPAETPEQPAAPASPAEKAPAEVPAAPAPEAAPAAEQKSEAPSAPAPASAPANV